MDGFHDTTTAGVTELRVHGVSGTPPADILNHPHPRQVCGDDEAGFYRRWWPGGQPTSPDADLPGIRRREAYAWGGLTSGGKTIALWLLLLPFALVNLAYFMLPRPAAASRWGVLLRNVAEAGLRLYALLLTGALVGAVTKSAVDLIGWQCAAAGRGCTLPGAPSWVQWLNALWPREISPRLALTALVPFAVVVLLWVIGRRTWKRDEATDMPSNGAEPAAALLAQPRLWHGEAPVGRLRALHLAFALGSIGLVVALPYTGTGVGLALTLANAGVQVAAVLLVLLPGVARRVNPRSGSDGRGLDVVCVVVRWAGLGAFVVTFLVALNGLPNGAPAYRLPTGVLGQVQFALTLGVALLLLAVVLGLALMDRQPEARRPVGGMASWFVLMAATACVNALGLGVVFWTASFFGVPDSMNTGITAAGPGRRLFLGDETWWTAALLPVVGVGAVVVGIVLVGVRLKVAAELGPKLAKQYGAENQATVAHMWALASLTDKAGLVLGVLSGFGLVGFAVVTVIYQRNLLIPVGGVAGLMATLGSWALAALLVGLVLLGRRAYSDNGLRRTVGILWDICTFWPRAIHPLAPPCYTERVIPDLLSRLRTLAPGDTDRVLLSGHSQGSVIAVAAIMQLPPQMKKRVSLLTHGSPLRRLYAAFFPAYFGPDCLKEVAREVKWINLYRRSDPIGGPIFHRIPNAAADPEETPRKQGSITGHVTEWATAELTESATGPLMGSVTRPASGHVVDRHCWDPARPEHGERLPIAYWHSDYWLDPAYQESVAILTERPGGPAVTVARVAAPDQVSS
ncbi:hypothetical protein [Nonomuraea endophytica]|uniref:Lipase family protein n=1 Tax=Nonomuraea endophytica TaxID=714136 RepID=A0A7W8ADL5_9ACTN|nr:hypothetical protein [Nonomuraea endophytica]MBB5084150.1 hypothetical protein [Nonomuraea endophytica]